MSHTPQQGSRVRAPLPEASPFSSVLARLPALSPPRATFSSSSFSHLNPLASPAPVTTFGYSSKGGQTPGSGSDGTKTVSAAFDLLAGTPMKSMPPEQQLGSPRFDLQSPKFPLFQPSPKKPLDSLRSPPSVRLGDSSAAPVRSFSSPFGSLLDGSSRSAPSPASAPLPGSTGPSPLPLNGAAAPRRQQQRFAALFAPGSSTLDAGPTDSPQPLPGLGPTYLSPLRPARHAASSGGNAADAADVLVQHQRQLGRQSSSGLAQRDALASSVSPAAAGPFEEVGAVVGLTGGMRSKARTHGVSASLEQGEEEEEEEEDDSAVDDDDDEDYTTSATLRRPPPRRPSTGAGAPGRQQQLFMSAQRPMRRRMLQFAAGRSSGSGGGEEEAEATPLVHSMLPQSPMCQPVRMEVDLSLLPIPRLRDPSSVPTASEAAGGSPAHCLRPADYSLDSPAVHAAAHAAVAAVLEASAGNGSVHSRRPARAAAAGAAAAAKAAAEAAGTPVQRRGSSHLGRSSSGVASLSSALLPPTPEEEGALLPPVVFSGPKKCNCKKSKCLKLYCDCFANGDFCGGSCSCTNCANKMENSGLVQAQREAIKQRNPNAFVQKIEADGMLGGQHRRGCNCRKSHCLKKYCECFQAGVPCGEHCKCESCHNTAGHPGRRPPGGVASKRARTSTAAAVTPRQTRQTVTRLASASGTALSEQLRAAAVQVAIARAGMAGSDRSEEHDDIMANVAQPMLFPVVPGVLNGTDGAAQSMLFPIMLQQPGAMPPPLSLPPATAAPALAAFAAAAATGPAPSHAPPVCGLVGHAGELFAAGGQRTMSDGVAFTFHPPPTDGSGSSSGQSTPRTAGLQSAAAAADFSFSLDTPAAASSGRTGSTALEKLLPVAAAGGAATAGGAAGKATPPASSGVRTTPTKRKPLRTMTAALH